MVVPHKPFAGRLAAPLALAVLAVFAVLAGVSCSSQMSSSAQDGAVDGVVGVCLLEYNSSQISGPTDGCCYHMGGVNSCNTNMTCSVSSGAQCCLLYATDATTGGDGCCLYEGGRTPYTAMGADRTSECMALITSGR